MRYGVFLYGKSCVQNSSPQELGDGFAKFMDAIAIAASHLAAALHNLSAYILEQAAR